MNTDNKHTQYTAKLSACLQHAGIPNLYKHGMADCIILKQDRDRAHEKAVEVFAPLGITVCSHLSALQNYATIELEGEDLTKSLLDVNA